MQRNRRVIRRMELTFTARTKETGATRLDDFSIRRKKIATFETRFKKNVDSMEDTLFYRHVTRRESDALIIDQQLLKNDKQYLNGHL